MGKAIKWVCIKHFFYGRIDFSEGIDVNSDISSSEYVMYHFRYFLT